MRRVVASLVVAALFIACFPSLDHLEHDAVTTPIDAAGMTDTGPDAPVEGGGDAGGCLSPIAVTAAPAEFAADVKTCNLENMLVIDGQTGGIYRDNPTGGQHTYDGHDLTSCAAFDFGKVVDAKEIDVAAKASQKTCSHQCNASAATDAGCNTGDFFWLYVGPSAQLGEAKYVTIGNLQPPMHTVESLKFTNFPTVDKRFVFICRSNASADRDDIEIDGVRLCPR